MNEFFSTRRLWLLLRGDALDGYRALLTTSAALAGMIWVSALLTRGASQVSDYLYIGWFVVMLFLWGILASSRAFRELHDKTRNERFLLLPASTAEKTIARLLTVTVGFVAYLLLFTFLVSLLVESWNSFQFGTRNAYFEPFSPIVWDLIPQYLVLHSIYFLGAAWFRRRHLAKTTLALALIIVGLILFTFLVAQMFLDSYGWENIGSALESLNSWSNRFLDAVLVGANVFYFFLLPPICWFTAWLRVAETQVSDGV